MFDQPKVLGMASALSANASARLTAIAQNVANADTPGYRARDAQSFQDSYRAASGPPMRATRPGHQAGFAGQTLNAVSERADGHMSPNGNNVSLEGEMLSAAGVRKDHDLALTIYRSSLGLFRTSLGRR